MKGKVINVELGSLLVRKDIQQKEIAVNTKTSVSTLNGYVKQEHPVPISKAALIAEKNGDDIFKGQMSYEFFGFIKSMDGLVADNCSPTELDVYQKKESNERKACKDTIEILLVESKSRDLESSEKDLLKTYVIEFMDEIIVELTIVFSILKIIGVSITQIMNERMSYWISKRYMRKGN
ncbi:MAG: hypothetical protein RR494_07960 [Vagococcus sp.]|uniref:hypothetical protein n=1 Tax=Vagococcus sp. TaxID=1933889 RepID=UPI002FCAD7FD